MRFAVLSSGSNANATYIEAGRTRVLIDCGLSAREAQRRLVSIGVDPTSLHAIFVTHEHSDHINGVSVLSKRLGIPVFTTPKTAKHFSRNVAVQAFEAGAEFEFAEISVKTFKLPHDAIDPVGYVIRYEDQSFAYATDLGHVSDCVRSALYGVQAVVLESNHDEELLWSCRYSQNLKERIASDHGHLSNHCAGALLRDLIPSGLKHAVLGHLSENSNTPEHALLTVRSYVESFLNDGTLTTLFCARRFEASPFVEIGESVATAALQA